MVPGCEYSLRLKKERAMRHLVLQETPGSGDAWTKRAKAIHICTGREELGSQHRHTVAVPGGRKRQYRLWALNSLWRKG